MIFVVVVMDTVLYRASIVLLAKLYLGRRRNDQNGLTSHLLHLAPFFKKFYSSSTLMSSILLRTYKNLASIIEALNVSLRLLSTMSHFDRIAKYAFEQLQGSL